MSMPITPVTGIPRIPNPATIADTGSQPGLFQSVLQNSIASVEHSGANASASVDRFLSGQGEELHHVAMSAQQAELSFELFMQVRNKVVNAYQEVMRMQL
jgi:flagellar hook-basal body complex protein FliE